jgi:hypothetical protein
VLEPKFSRKQGKSGRLHYSSALPNIRNYESFDKFAPNNLTFFGYNFLQFRKWNTQMKKSVKVNEQNYIFIFRYLCKLNAILSFEPLYLIIIIHFIHTQLKQLKTQRKNSLKVQNNTNSNRGCKKTNPGKVF